MAVILLTQDIIVSVCATAVQPRQPKWTTLSTGLDKPKGLFFTGLTFNTLAVPVMWLTTCGVCVVLKTAHQNRHCDGKNTAFCGQFYNILL